MTFYFNLDWTFWISTNSWFCDLCWLPRAWTISTATWGRSSCWIIGEHDLPTRWSASTYWRACFERFGSHIPGQVDRLEWPRFLATQIPRPYTCGLLSLGVRQKSSISITYHPVTSTNLGKNTGSFSTPQSQSSYHSKCCWWHHKANAVCDSSKRPKYWAVSSKSQLRPTLLGVVCKWVFN